MWVLDKDNNAEFVPTKAVTGECNGREAGKNSPVDPNFTLEGATGVVHSHTYEVLPFPGPEDGVIPSHYGIPNYGISPNGIWVVNPGPPLSVSLLSGSWGKGPSGERFNPSAYTALINDSAPSAHNPFQNKHLKCFLSMKISFILTKHRPFFFIYNYINSQADYKGAVCTLGILS